MHESDNTQPREQLVARHALRRDKAGKYLDGLEPVSAILARYNLDEPDNERNADVA